jgi:hypothetical protein
MNKSPWLGVKIYENNLPNFKTLESPIEKELVKKILEINETYLDNELKNKLNSCNKDLFVWAGLQGCFKKINNFRSASIQTDFKIIIINDKKGTFWLFDVLDYFEDINREIAGLVNWGNGIMWKDVLFLVNKNEGVINEEILKEIRLYSNGGSNPAFHLPSEKSKKVLELIKCK